MLTKIQDGSIKLAVIGLGYVGLPLAVEFGKKYDTIGFDRKVSRLESLRRGIDATLETSAGQLRAAGKLRYTDDIAELRDRDRLSGIFRK